MAQDCSQGSQAKMFVTGGKRCPVMLFEEMLARHPPEMKDSGPFYLTTISKPKSQVYFGRQRMGEHKIEQLMKDMAVKSGLTAATGKKNYQPFDEKNMYKN